MKNLFRKAKTKTTIPEVFELRAKAARFNPLRNLAPETLAHQLDEFRNGRFTSIAQTFELIEERDPLIKPTASKRKKEVARHGWEVLTVEDTEDPEAEAHKEALEYFFNNLTATSVVDEDETGGLRLAIRQMMNAIGVKYAVHEIVWKPQAGGKLTAELRYVPLWFFEHEGSRLGFLREYGQVKGEPLLPGEWMVTVGDTLMVSSSICYMFKRLPMQDWLSYCEKFGIPGVKGKTSASQGSKEWEAMEDAVASFANEFAAVMSLTDDIETIERKGGGEVPFPGLIDVCDRYIATLWRGADLGTISKGQGLGASLQGEESDLLLDDDIEMISETLQTKISRFVIEYLFGPGVEPLAYIQILKPQQDNSEKDLKIDETLHRMGFPMSKQDLSERYQRTMPDSDEDLLAPVTAAPQPGEPGEAKDGKQPTDPQGKATDTETAANEGSAATPDLPTRIERALAGGTHPDELRSILTDIEGALAPRMQPLAKAIEAQLTTALIQGATTKPTL